MERTHFEAIVIGSGQGGFPLAMALAGKGRETALVEMGALGGTCVNTGCTPTKTMVASARAAHIVSRSGEYGVSANPSGVDLSVVRARKRGIVGDFRGASESAAENTKNLTLMRGKARFSGPKEVVVTNDSGDGAQTLTADQIFINTGTKTNVPPIEGLDALPFLTNETIMELDEVPKHLAIIGGGYIGVEFGQMFRRFGSEVTILQRGDQLLPREDTDIAEEATEILRGEGIAILTNAQTKRVTTSESGHIALEVDVNRATKQLQASHLLVATGRRPNSDELNLEAAGIETDKRGYIVVNDRLETGVEGIWALGDVKGGPAFTHISYDDSRVIQRNLWGDGKGTIEGRVVAYTVFMDPQLGRVGMSERQARESGRSIHVASMPMTSVARALETDETRGMVKAVVDAETERILGFAMLGIEGGEIAGAVQLVMLADQPYTILRDTPFSHPTVLESMNNLFSKFS